MKSIFIVYNQAYEDLILRLLDRQMLRGYTNWETVRGRGSITGEPHLGSHAWPTLNGALMTICPDDKVASVLDALKELDTATPEQGLRAFVWQIDQSYP